MPGEVEVGGGAERPSVASRSGGPEDVAAALSRLRGTPVDDPGRGLGEACSDSLRSSSDRAGILRRLVDELCPDEAVPEVWSSWLSGGHPPFRNGRLNRLAVVDGTSGQTVSRNSDRVSTAAVAVARAEERLESARNNLENAKSIDRAVLHVLVGEDLKASMRAMFAMGPAWTLVRVLSDFISDEAAARQFVKAEPKRLALMVENLRKARRDKSAEIMRALDYWSGDIDFETDLRDAIELVVNRYAGRQTEPSRKRSVERMRESVPPHGKQHRDDVVAGFGASGRGSSEAD